MQRLGMAPLGLALQRQSIAENCAATAQYSVATQSSGNARRSEAGLRRSHARPLLRLARQWHGFVQRSTAERRRRNVGPGCATAKFGYARQWRCTAFHGKAVLGTAMARRRGALRDGALQRQGPATPGAPAQSKGEAKQSRA